jgi:hypothetical protein
MSVLLDIPEIEYWGIYERGVPNAERIVFKPRIPLNLTSYAIIVGIESENRSLVPIHDSNFYFPEVIVYPPAWVFVFTCKGTTMVNVERTTKEPTHNLFWGRSQVVFGHSSLTAAIVRIDAMLYPPHLEKRIDSKQYQLPLDATRKLTGKE